MNPALKRSTDPRILFGMLLAGVAGCTTTGRDVNEPPIPVVRAAQPDSLPLHFPKDSVPAAAPEQGQQPIRAIPISLDTVFRLAQDQNGQVAIAREKLSESYVKSDLAALSWLPDLYVGTAYGRHEGGISDFYGNLIKSSYGMMTAGALVQGNFDLREVAYKKVDAERQVWQQKGELSKLTSENLLDASSTYVDLLAAYSGEAIAHEMEVKLDELRSRAQKLAEIDPGAKVEVARVDAELSSQKQISRKMRENIVAATAKLNYLLGLDPGIELAPVERRINVLRLVDANTEVHILVDQAISKGPGVRELSSIIRVIEDAREKASGLTKFMPILGVTVNEGLYGTGPDASMSFANQLNVLVSAKWNLTETITARQRQKLVDSRIHQAQLSFRELKGKLALGVQEARESSLSNREMMVYGEAQIRSAEESFNLSDYRLKNNIKGASPSEVLLSLRSVIGARLAYLNTVRELDKSQLRLFILVGNVECHD